MLYKLAIALESVPKVDLSTSEKIMEGLTATVIGMGIVFAVLALIALILSFFKFMSPQDQKPKPKAAEGIQEPVDDTFQIEADNPDYVDAQEDELIAVISAAVAAYLGEGSKPVIKSVRPARNSYSPWNIAAKRESQRGLN